MGETVRRTVVVSAVNLRKGGTLAILRSCLEYLSGRSDEFRIVALVHSRAMCDYPGIEYIEMPWCVKGWLRRMWAEYVTMHGISLELARQDGGRKVWMWLSLHDTTPRVVAEHREVYCHTSFPFMKPQLRDLFMDPKILLFSLFTRWAYRINVHKNDCLIVQQNWFADAMSQMLGVPRSKIRVIPPDLPILNSSVTPIEHKEKWFVFISTPDCHKNFETLCRAAGILEAEVGTGQFKVIISVKGDENRYARYLFKKWGGCSSIDFRGFLTRGQVTELYASADCMVFPSRIESWGLPISEYMSMRPGGKMLLADLPYAHETSSESGVFFFPSDPLDLARKMKDILTKNDLI